MIPTRGGNKTVAQWELFVKLIRIPIIYTCTWVFLASQSNWWRWVKPKSTPHESAKCRSDISGCERSKGESKTICFSFWTRDNGVPVNYRSRTSVALNWSALKVITLISEFHCRVLRLNMSGWWKLFASISITEEAITSPPGTTPAARRLRSGGSVLVMDLLNHRQPIEKLYVTLSLV